MCCFHAQSLLNSFLVSLLCLSYDFKHVLACFELCQITERISFYFHIVNSAFQGVRLPQEIFSFYVPLFAQLPDFVLNRLFHLVYALELEIVTGVVCLLLFSVHYLNDTPPLLALGNDDVFVG